MKKTLFILLVGFVLMEGVSAWVLRQDSFEKNKTPQKNPSMGDNLPNPEPAAFPPTSQNSDGQSSSEENFPPPSTEVVNGVTERTIHMGVRKWAWDPPVIRVREGERVRLIIHNADSKHSLVIPDLGVNQDIPEEGAVIEFLAEKKGAFDFLCGVYCGVGHAEMKGTLIVE